MFYQTNRDADFMFFRILAVHNDFSQVVAVLVWATGLGCLTIEGSLLFQFNYLIQSESTVLYLNLSLLYYTSFEGFLFSQITRNASIISQLIYC